MQFRVFRKALPLERTGEVTEASVDVNDFGFNGDDVIQVEYNIYPVSNTQVEVVGVLTVLDEEDRQKIENMRAKAAENILGDELEDEDGT